MKHLVTRLKVKPKDLFIGAGIGIILAIISTVFKLGPLGVMASVPFTLQDIAASAPTPNAPLTAHSTSQAIIALMLNSHTKWTSLTAQAVTHYPGGGIASSITIQQYGKVHSTQGPLDQPATSEWISDNTTFWEIDHLHQVYTQDTVPESRRSLDKYNPPAPPGDGVAFAVPYPLDGFIPSILSSYIYPQGLAQSLSQWKTTIAGTGVIAQRETVVVLFQVIDDEGVVLKKHRYWIDSQTGLVLQSEIYAQADLDNWAEQTTFTSIKYDAPIAAQTFTFQPASDLKRVTALPEYLHPF